MNYPKVKRDDTSVWMDIQIPFRLDYNLALYCLLSHCARDVYFDQPLKDVPNCKATAIQFIKEELLEYGWSVFNVDYSQRHIEAVKEMIKLKLPELVVNK
jgi:hypothetical protein